MKSFDASDGSPTKKYVVMVDFQFDVAGGCGFAAATEDAVGTLEVAAIVAVAGAPGVDCLRNIKNPPATSTMLNMRPAKKGNDLIGGDHSINSAVIKKYD